jgi:signal transduction histidine kinase
MFTMLIVDDHKHLVESLATTIPWEQYGITRVYQAYSGQEALELVTQQPVDILITDIRMPVMSGLELIEAVRGLHHPATDCVLLTGYSDFQYAKRAVELQAVNYLLKPVRDEELLETIQRITARRREQQAAEHQVTQLKADLLEARTEAKQTLQEERNRIAYDIHDIVGHTLTTTLLQIEAAKLLIQKNEPEGMVRLTQSQELVRKSLQDIREAVRMMKWPNEHADLEEDLRSFIAEAEKAAGITVECSIELPERITDSYSRKAIYHALQEGLTNGIRHGGARAFRFRLIQLGRELIFLLWNDGTPFDSENQGFGLPAMQDRVRQAGGTLTIGPSSEPDGTLLTIHIPR